MRHFLLTVCLLGLLSCRNDEKQKAETARAQSRQEAVFANIDRSWRFSTQPANEASQGALAEWAEWRSFVEELSRKPQRTISAFRRKASTLSLRAAALQKGIPQRFDKPEIRARVAVITTKVNSLNLYMSLQDIPDQKVLAIIGDINREMLSVQSQMAEIVRKSQIPKEIGEAEMIRMLDTSRAVK